MVHKIILGAAFFMSTALYADGEAFAIEVPTTTVKMEFPRVEEQVTTPSHFYPYIGLGFSTIAILPYGANIGLGSRYVRERSFLGLDGSVNFTSTFISQYIFAKGLVPIYLTPEMAKNSYYMGPFLAAGYNHQLVKIDRHMPRGDSLLLVHGVSFGKNIEKNGTISFWQLSANLRQYRIASKPADSVWPTLTFQYGVGF